MYPNGIKLWLGTCQQGSSILFFLSVHTNRWLSNSRGDEDAFAGRKVWLSWGHETEGEVVTNRKYTSFHVLGQGKILHHTFLRARQSSAKPSSATPGGTNARSDGRAFVRNFKMNN